MGAAASVEGDEVTKEQAMQLAGDKFNEQTWKDKAFMGVIDKDEWANLVAADSIPKIYLAHLQKELAQVHAAGKTPLILDPHNKVSVFFQVRSLATPRHGRARHAPCMGRVFEERGVVVAVAVERHSHGLRSRRPVPLPPRASLPGTDS